MSQQSLRVDAQVPDMEADAVAGGPNPGQGDPLEERLSRRGEDFGRDVPGKQRTEPVNPWGRDLSPRGGAFGTLRTGVPLTSRASESLCGRSAPEESWLRDVSPRGGGLGTPGGGGLLSPGGHRKRHSFDVEEAGDDRAPKFMRRSIELERDATGAPADVTEFLGDVWEFNEPSEMTRTWGQQIGSADASRSFCSSALTAVEERATGVSALSAGLHRSPLDRSVSVRCSPQQTRKLTPRARSASPRLRQAAPVSMLSVHRAELSPSRFSPNPGFETTQSWDEPSRHRTGYVDAQEAEIAASPSEFQSTAPAPSMETPSSPSGAFPRSHPLSPVETYVVRTGREVAYVSTRYPSYRSPGGAPLGQQTDQGVSPMDVGTAAEPLGSTRQSEGQRAVATWTHPCGDSCTARDGDSGRVREDMTSALGGDETSTPMDTSEPPQNDEDAPAGGATALSGQPRNGVGGAFTPLASHPAGFVTDEPPANSLVSQVSLSHWANLTLDLACLNEMASPVPEAVESAELGDISPLELPPQKTWESPTTTPAFSAGAGPSFRDGVDTVAGKAGQDPPALCGGVKKSLSRENLGLPRRGSREFREQQAAELALVAADVTTWLGILRGGLKRQGRERGWTQEERAAAKRLASAALLGETIVQSKC